MSDVVKKDIIDLIEQYGFDICRFTSATQKDSVTAYFEKTIEKDNFYGDMTWMYDHAYRRKDIPNLWHEAKTAIIVGMNYYNGSDSLAALQNKNNALISCYAHGKDYHDVMKKKLKQIAQHIVQHYHCQVKLFVDTAPILEKPLAEKAGLGWQGKHSNIVSSQFGSWLFLGEILTDLDLPYDNDMDNHCGSCRQCIDICPTQAIEKPYQLTIKKCISYWTIEHKGNIPDIIADKMANRIYGCDDCLAICPWNKFAQKSKNIAFYDEKKRINWLLQDYLSLDESAFRQLFSKSPIKRIGWVRFMRNCSIAAGNSGNINLYHHLQKLSQSDHAVISYAAHWGINKLQYETHHQKI